MKSFKKTDIDVQREKFVKGKYPQKIAEIDNRSIDYFVIPQKLFGGIPNGLFRMTGNPNDGYLVGVSEEVPEIIKPYFAVSEHDEFMIYGLDDLDRTLNSETNMLRILENEDSLRKNYIDNKLMLYEYMLKHSKEEWQLTQEDYCGFQRAVEFLKDK